MKIRIRGPSGVSTVELEESATVKDLKSKISAQTLLHSFDVKYGYPPKPLILDQHDPSTKLSEIGTKLNGEQLIVSKTEGTAIRGAPDIARPKARDMINAQPSGNAVKELAPTEAGPSGEFSFEGVGEAPPTKETRSTKVKLNPPKGSTPSKPLSPSRKKMADIENDPPEVALPDHGATLVLRIMPDDNSCLFRAVGNAVLGGMDTMNELRSVVAQTIQEQPEVYSEAMLDKQPDEYCRWIQTEDAWGGGIELGILSQNFDIEICSIDVQTLRIDRFNEGKPTRCIVVYSGIHYDNIALAYSDPPYTHATSPPEFDTKVFESGDEVVLQAAIELCRVLQSKHYYTDTAGFSIKCNICGELFVGEKGAAGHAQETGHYDFGEAG